MAKTPTYYKTGAGQYYTGPNQKVTDSDILAGLEGGKVPFSTVQKGLEGQFVDPKFFSKERSDEQRKQISNSMSVPTVFSDANLRENVIPEINSKAQKIGAELTSYGTQTQTSETDLEKAYSQYLNPPTEENDPYLSLIKQMQEKSDLATQNLLNATSMEYSQLQQELRQSQTGSNAALRGSLGRMGSRYTPISSNNLMQAQLNSNAQALAKLQSMETIDKQKILAAQEDKDFQLMGKQIEILEGRRKEKAAIAEQMITAIQKQREEIQKQERMATLGNAVAEFMSNGVTNKAEMLKTLNAAGGDFSAKELGEAVTSLTGAENEIKGSSDIQDYFTLRDFGMLPDFITSLPPQDQFGAFTSYRKGLEKGEITPQGTPVVNVNKVAPINDLTQIDDLPVSTLTKSVMAGFGKLKDLTPTDKAKVLKEMYSVGFNPQTYVMNKLNNLITLYAQIPENQKGVIEGFVKPWATYTQPTVANFESAKEVLTREIARLNDVGMLSDQDVASYKNSLPSRMDSSLGIVLNKIAGLSSTIAGKKAANVGKTGILGDGRQFIVSFDGETLLDPITGEPLENNEAQ